MHRPAQTSGKLSVVDSSRSNGAARSTNWTTQCTNSAIKMMIGIGTPRNKSSSERMMNPP
jgi:hypothetical protein